MANVPHSGLSGADLHANKAYRTTFTNASLSSGILTVNHALAQQYVVVTIVDNNGKVILPDDVTMTDTNNAAVDLSSFGTIVGTWRVTVTL